MVQEIAVINLTLQVGKQDISREKNSQKNLILIWRGIFNVVSEISRGLDEGLSSVNPETVYAGEAG